MKTYTVHAKRWSGGWELHIDDVGVTQSHGLADADRMARDYVSLVTDAPADSFELEIVPEIGGGLDAEIRKARVAVRKAVEVQRDAARRSREVAGRLKSNGLTGRDIAAALGVSPQRASQLLRGVGTSTRRSAAARSTGRVPGGTARRS